MSEAGGSDTRPTDPVGRALYPVTRTVSLIGGGVLCAMAVLTVISVFGRYFFYAPVMGDFELIAIGTGVSVFAFLPHCQLMRENVAVDFFLSNAPFRLKTFFDIVGNLIYAAIILLLTWRSTLGSIGLYEADEMTLILEIPRWWTLPTAMLCLVLLLVVCVYSTWRSISEMRQGRTS